ncbi:MAG: nickel pincer cofactor biosynthesis protein LarC, partial [Peptococcaceae bacterium]|nr:nickel pincer cofactor biosynthesis protein LarC [Peptococcaceae bacterium]
MKIAYFDCFSGISGDMILGALVDAGLEIERLRQELALLHLTGYELQAEKVRKQGIAATRVRVLTAESPEQRRLADIRRLIQDSALPSQVKERSVRIFTRLAEAEGKIHQSAAEEIHFHEVGALDAIVDIVGSVLGLHQLGIGKIVSSPLCTGKGFVQCAHGWLPVPAPATLELLRGCPIYAGEIDKELVTPTGAAILSTLSAGFGDMPPLRVRTVGYGAGGYELERPNVVRLILG